MKYCSQVWLSMGMEAEKGWGGEHHRNNVGENKNKSRSLYCFLLWYLLYQRQSQKVSVYSPVNQFYSMQAKHLLGVTVCVYNVNYVIRRGAGNKNIVT